MNFFNIERPDVSKLINLDELQYVEWMANKITFVFSHHSTSVYFDSHKEANDYYNKFVEKITK